MTAADSPEVSVVIATGGRETRLAFALEALADQTLGRERFEVVVVRAGSSDGALATAPPGMEVRFLEHRGPPGAAAQRNAGWRAARAPLVAFVDDDSRPTPRWLEALLGAGCAPDVIVQGPIEPDPGERHLLYGLARSHEIDGPSDRFETGNIAYPRALLERLGGFDEGYPSGSWGEDTDLGLRAMAAGARTAFAPDALVHHAVLPRTLVDALRETSRYAWLVRLAARYPDHRRRHYPRRVVKPVHVTLALALAGAPAARRRPVLAAALATPYVAAHLRTHLETNPVSARSMARFGAHLPQRALVELAELVVVVATAARERTLLI